jgi:hypothetical protein
MAVTRHGDLAFGMRQVTVMERLLVAVSTGLEESVTSTEKSNVPEAVASPVIDPFGLSVKPVGSAPAVTDQVNGVVPPVAANVVE